MGTEVQEPSLLKRDQKTLAPHKCEKRVSNEWTQNKTPILTN